MHIVKDENGNICAHAHDHVHPHTHSYEHTHEHSHQHGHEEDHDHSHTHGEHASCEGQECAQECTGCGHSHEDHAHSEVSDKNTALLNYMLQHNEHHAAELDMLAGKLKEDGQEDAAEQIRRDVDEYQKGNLYLKLAAATLAEKK